LLWILWAVARHPDRHFIFRKYVATRIPHPNSYRPINAFSEYIFRMSVVQLQPRTQTMDEFGSAIATTCCGAMPFSPTLCSIRQSNFSASTRLIFVRGNLSPRHTLSLVFLQLLLIMRALLPPIQDSGEIQFPSPWSSERSSNYWTSGVRRFGSNAIPRHPRRNRIPQRMVHYRNVAAPAEEDCLPMSPSRGTRQRCHRGHTGRQTTLDFLLLRFYDIPARQILLDAGHSLIELAGLPAIRIVLQTVSFHRTIETNIGSARPGIDRARVEPPSTNRLGEFIRCCLRV